MTDLTKSFQLHHRADRAGLPRIVWSTAWLLWFKDRLEGPEDIGPKKKHFARAKIMYQPFY